jgi:hypothetical protein
VDESRVGRVENGGDLAVKVERAPMRLEQHFRSDDEQDQGNEDHEEEDEREGGDQQRHTVI